MKSFYCVLFPNQKTFFIFDFFGDFCYSEHLSTKEHTLNFQKIRYFFEVIAY